MKSPTRSAPVRGKMLKYILAMAVNGFPVLCHPGQFQDILPAVKVSESNISTWATPIAYKNGNLFFVAVTPPPAGSNGRDLSTVIYKGIKTSDGWNWETKVIDSGTLNDQWHNIPSLAVDPDGYIHVAYNMHNMPWQYSVSRQPLNINEFTFKGEAVTNLEKFAVKQLNKTPFSSKGKAEIPGN